MNRRGRRAVGSSYRVHEGSIVVHGSARLTRHVLCQLRQRIDAVARPPGSEALGEANCYNHMALDSRRKPVEKEREREREREKALGTTWTRHTTLSERGALWQR
jgi:hypothetical protein